MVAVPCRARLNVRRNKQLVPQSASAHDHAHCAPACMLRVYLQSSHIVRRDLPPSRVSPRGHIRSTALMWTQSAAVITACMGGGMHACTRGAYRIKELKVPALLAGGAVRDHLLGLEPTDYDIAAGLGTAELLSLFPGSRQMRNAVGTVEVPGALPGSSVEVTPMRNFGPASAACFWAINRARCALAPFAVCMHTAPVACLLLVDAAVAAAAALHMRLPDMKSGLCSGAARVEPRICAFVQNMDAPAVLRKS